MLVYKKLLQVQTALKAPKNQYNSFGKYLYRSCEDILEGLKPALDTVGATVMITDEAVTVGDRYYIKATATFIDVDTGEHISNTALAREENEKKGMDGSQVTGTASSYARKYALNGLFLIDDTKDADTDEHQNQTKGGTKQQNSQKQQNTAKANNNTAKQQKAQETAQNASQTQQRDKDSKVTEEEKQEIILLADKEGIDVVKMVEAFGTARIEELTYTNYRQIKKNVDQLKEKFPTKKEEAKQ